MIHDPLSNASALCSVGGWTVVNCGRPDVDYNGVVTGDDWWVGSLVRYECRAGFLLLGDPTRVCQSDGRWTPKPFCVRELTQTHVLHELKQTLPHELTQTLPHE